MGSGNYRNSAINPANNFYKLSSLIDDSKPYGEPYFEIRLVADAYWENGWWGGTGDNVSINESLTNYINVSKRDWYNSLLANVTYTGLYNNKTAYYSTTPFTATATNLNNFLKVNDTKITPIIDSIAIPYKDGFHIAINQEGKTKVSIENGSENRYEDYYCFVDSTLPDVEFVYDNANAMDKATYSKITTNSQGQKTQEVYAGTFKDKMFVVFGGNDIESPETATYTLNGKTYPYTSGHLLYEEGDYELIVQDLVGHQKIITFTIDKTSPSYNLNLLQNEKNYKVSKWYLTTIPNSMNGSGTFSFRTQKEALEYAIQIEKENFVTTHLLSNIKDFTQTHLVANNKDENNNEDQIRLGEYWYYKSRDNPDLYLYYFDKSLLNKVIAFYAENYVSKPQYYKLNGLNTYGTYASDIISNIWNEQEQKAYIINGFTFKYVNDNETYKIYYDYQEDNEENYIQFLYGEKFENQVSDMYGLYKIKEIDYVGHETFYFVYLDKSAPTIEYRAKVYGENKSFAGVLSTSDIPSNKDLTFYYETFLFAKILDSDTWWVMEITLSNKKYYYTYLDTLPILNDIGNGEFKIKLYDRVCNTFEFTIFILGQAPSVKFTPQNTNLELLVTITKGESFNSIMDLKIYKNEILLNNVNGYDEYPERNDNGLIFISNTTLSYTFSKGGNYKVELTDNFGRTIVYEYTFEKDLPKGILSIDNGSTTRENVTFKFNNQKYFVDVKRDNISFLPNEELDSTNTLTTLTFLYEEDMHHHYVIKLININDFDNFNTYTFAIDRQAPLLELVGVENNGTTSNSVYATWDLCEQAKANYTRNSLSCGEYLRTQKLSSEGSYSITIQDYLGNARTYKFTIDRSLDFEIYENDNLINITDHYYTNQNIKIVNLEELNIQILADNKNYPYEFNEIISLEGIFSATIFDDYNNRANFVFTIDKTPPDVTLNGVEDNGITSQIVSITFNEEGLTATYFCNDIHLGIYTENQELKASGRYRIEIQDKAKNIKVLSFEIDKNLSYSINVLSSGATNEYVKIFNYEPLKIEVFHNRNLLEYEFGNELNLHGFYIVKLSDDLGNLEQVYFWIIKHAIQSFENTFLDNVVIDKMSKDDEPFDAVFVDKIFTLKEDGHYEITLQDNTLTTNTFYITIDTIPPTIELVGVENGGKTKSDINTKNPSEENIKILAKLNDKEIKYKIGDTLRNVGVYSITISDEAGNQTHYSFEKEYSLNAGSIALLGGLIAIAVVVTIFVIRSRRGLYVEVEEE